MAESAVVVHAEGDLDVYTAPRLKEVLDEHVAGAKRLVLDLSEVHFIDSTALAVLVGALQQSQATDGEFRLVVSDPFLLKIFHITGFDGIFPIYSAVAEALDGV
ncbi:MAG: STAS domain-containing protein [Thermoleophilia bacterium]|nr:STAS domain-containing protein [Thermoleophilia bacterium]